MGLSFGDRRSKARNRSEPGSGAVEFALDLKPEAVTLCERKPHGSWRKFASAQLDDPEFSTVIGLLRDDAETYAGARLPVRLWLPAEQVLKKTVRLRRGLSPEERLEAVFDHVEEKAVYRPEDIAIAVAPAEAGSGEESGETTILITFAETWREARSYAERWGFLPGEVSTRHEAEAFGAAGPVFRLRPDPVAAVAEQRSGRGLIAGVALAGVAAVLALVLLRPWETAPPPEPAPPLQVAAAPETETPPAEPVEQPPAPPAVAEPKAGPPLPDRAALPGSRAESGQAPAPAGLAAAPPAPEPPAPEPSAPEPSAPEPDPLAARSGAAAPEPQFPLAPSSAEIAGILLARAPEPAEPVDQRNMLQAPQARLRAPEALPEVAPPRIPEPQVAEPGVAEPEVAEPGVAEAGVAEAGAPGSEAAAPEVPAPETAELEDAEPEAADDPAWPVPVPRPELPEADKSDAATGAAILGAPRPKARPAELPRLRKDNRSQLGGSAKLESAALVGVFNLETGRKALLRLPDGQFRSVAVGDLLDGWKVTMIGRDAMRVTRQGRDRTLLLVRP